MKLSIVTGFFLPVPPLRGGSTEKIWHRMAQEFAAAGHEVTFVSRRWPGLPEEETVAGVRHLRLPGADHRRSLAANLLNDARWGLRVARALPPADLVVCNTVTLPVWLGRVKPRAGRVVSVIARMPKGHGRFYGAVDLLLSLSPAVTDALTAENPRLASKIAAFPYPIDWSRHAAAAAARPAARLPLTLGYIGRLHPEKGLSLLLEAAARLARDAALPAWRIELTGPHAVAQGGGGDAYLEDLRRRFGGELGDRLVLRGPEFDVAKLADRYAGLDVFCYPSIAEQGETFGVAVAEAQAARCATVVSELECFRSLVTPGETGLTFNHRSADAAGELARALSALLADAPLRTALATRGQRHVRQFDYPEIAARVLADFRRLVLPAPSSKMGVE